MIAPAAILSRPSCLILNAILFQLVWWVSVLYQDVTAWVAALLYFAIHFSVVSQNRIAELKFIASVACIGIVADALQFYVGVMLNDGNHILPHWLVPIWLAFAATLPHSLQWLSPWALLAALFGAVFGPASYWAGTHFTLVSFQSPELVGLLTLAVFWAFFFPASFKIWQRFAHATKPA